MNWLAPRAGRATGARSAVVDASTSREISALSQEGAQSSRGRGRLRAERGQAAVEFALIVPVLLLIVVAILNFGKVMNYWLDLNHVASDGARKAAVNTYGTDGEYASYIRSRLETGELRTGGTTSIPAASTIAICLPEGPDVGDPVTVQVAVGYRLPFVGRTVTIRGTATMRLEQPADFAGTGGCT